MALKISSEVQNVFEFKQHKNSSCMSSKSVYVYLTRINNIAWLLISVDSSSCIAQKLSIDGQYGWSDVLNAKGSIQKGENVKSLKIDNKKFLD